MIKRNISATIGNVLEWYDFCLYGYFAPLLAQAFFPNKNIYLSLMYIFLTFACGYIMRPLGGLLFGHLGDVIDRGYALYYAIYLITLPTFLIGILPNYNHFGILAPILLVVIRMLQGLSAGGQYSGALTYLHGKAPANKAAQTVGLVYIGCVGGYLLASFIGYISTKLFNNEWAWRIPFLLTIFFLPLLKFCKKNLLNLKVCPVEKGKLPIKILFIQHKFIMLKALLLACVGGVYYASFFIFLVSYLKVYVNLAMSSVLLINIFCLISSGIFILVFAKIADRIGRKPLILFSSLGFVFILFPTFLLMNTGVFFYCLLGVWLLTTCNTIFMAGCSPVYTELFPVNVQFSGCAFCYNIGAGIVGGLTPFFLTFLLHKFNFIVMSGFLILCAMFAVILILYFIPETLKIIGVKNELEKSS